MIQGININIQTGQKIKETLPMEINHVASKDGADRLNIYESHLKVTSPTYSKDVKEIMNKNGIEDNYLNSKIVETMRTKGINVSKNALDIVVNQLQKDHIFNLFKDGYELDELTVDIIAKEVLENEKGPILDECEEEDIDKELYEALSNAGLPTTNKNLETLRRYRDRLENIIDSSDISIINMVRNKADISINGLYSSKHMGNPKDINENPTNEQIIAVLNMNGIKVTQENMNAARNLIRGSIEITRQSVKDFVDIKDIINKMNTKDLLENAAREIKNGNNPADMNINEMKTNQLNEYNKVKESVEAIIEDIPNIDEKIIEDTYISNRPITLENLQKTLHENIDKLTSKEGQDEEIKELEPEIKEEVAIRKRQLEEIRLKLTLEAALKLNKKLDIETSDLSKVVEELKLIEEVKNEEILKNIGISASKENLDQMKRTSESLYNVSQNREIAVAKVVKEEIDFTLEGMDEAIKLEHAQQVYEERGTRPERRFGESIASVEDQLEHILEINQIEVNDANLKAAKTLVEGKIDISKEAIEDAKAVIVKIETVLYEMKPVLVAKMIKDGINPDTMQIDNLIENIREIQRESNIDPTQKVAEAILELDKANELSPKERDGLIGVYRMLNTISKNETAAIGFLLDNDKEPTLGNLFEASKYIKEVGSKTGKMDIRVDDDLGIRQGDLPENIRSIIREATSLAASDENIDKWLNTRNIIDQWLSRISPEELKTYIDMDKSLEELELTEDKISDYELGRVSKQVEALEKPSAKTLTFLKDNKVPLTIANIYWADKVIKDPYLLGSMLEEYENLSQEKLSSSMNKNNDKENLEEILEAVEEEIKDNSHKCLSVTDNIKAYNTGKELLQLLDSQKKIFEDEGIYQIPVELHSGMTNLNLYVLRDKEEVRKEEADELKAHMSIKTKNLGVVQVDMRISDKAVAFEMKGETPEITLGLQKDSNKLKVAIEEIGYNVMQAKFTQYKEEKSLIEKPELSKSLLEYRFDESKFEHII